MKLIHGLVLHACILVACKAQRPGDIVDTKSEWEMYQGQDGTVKVDM